MRASRGLVRALVAAVVAALLVFVGAVATADSGHATVADQAADGLLAFTQFRDQEGPGGAAFYAIYVVRPDGTGVRRLTERCLDCAADPRWSPDGSKIAYSEPDGIHVMNQNGGGKQRLCTYPCWRPPAWSPDGRRIAVGLNGGGIGIVAARGGPVRRIPGSQLRPESIDWSPDGKQLAIGDSGGRVLIMNSDGRGLRLIARDAASPRWSPNGKQLLFAQYDGSVIYLKGRGAPRVIRRLPEGHALSLSWSPDGTQIAYSGDDIHTLDLANGHDRHIKLPRVCRPFSSCYDVDWQLR